MKHTIKTSHELRFTSHIDLDSACIFTGAVSYLICHVLHFILCEYDIQDISHTQYSNTEKCDICAADVENCDLFLSHTLIDLDKKHKASLFMIWKTRLHITDSSVWIE